MGLQATSSPTPTFVPTHVRIHQMRRLEARPQEPAILKMSEYKGPVGNQDALAVKKTTTTNS